MGVWSPGREESANYRFGLRGYFRVYLMVSISLVFLVFGTKTKIVLH